MYESGRNGPLRISAGANARIALRTFDRLQSLRLVDHDTSTGFYRGQRPYATAAGHTALDAFTATDSSAAWLAPSPGRSAPLTPTHRRTALPEPDDELYLVTPRYLAGPGPIEDVIAPLVGRFSWACQQDDRGRITATSPDETTSVDFNPRSWSGQWWTVTQRGEQDWRAVFTRQTPAETISAVTQSLPQLRGDHRYVEPLNTGLNPFAAAGFRRWRPPGDDPTVRVSPDGHCTLRHTPDGETAWRVEASVHDGYDTQWSAAFSAHTPTALVTRFITDLTTSEPVLRHYDSIPALAVPDAVITRLNHRLGNARRLHALYELHRDSAPSPPGSGPRPSRRSP